MKSEVATILFSLFLPWGLEGARAAECGEWGGTHEEVLGHFGTDSYLCPIPEVLWKI
jgi:hypothetical protein